MLRRSIATIVLILLLISGSFAEESVMLDEIVVRGQEQSPQTTDLTIREVRESPARDMGEALQNVPGMTFVRKGAIASDVVLRGLQRDNINVLLDGVRLYGGCPSRMDPPSFHFDFSEVESIRVVRGPYDLSFPGSLGGSIHAVSATPPEGPGFRFNATAGSNEMIHASATASYGFDKHDLLGGYANKYSLPPKSGDGKRITDIYPATSNNRYRDENIDSRAYDIQTAWGKSGFKFGETGRSEIGYSYQDAGHVLYPYLLMDADYDRTHRVNWTTRTEDRHGPFTASELQLWWDRVEHVMSDRYRVSSLPGMMVTRDYGMLTDSETSVYGARGNGTFDFGKGRVKAGIDYYRRNWDAVNTSAMFSAYLPQPMIPDVDLDNLGAFAEYSRPLADNWTVGVGARVDRTTADAGDLDTTRLANFYQPYYPGNPIDDEADFSKVGGNLQLTWAARDGLDVFLGIATSVRPPDPQELYIGLQRAATVAMPNAVSWIGNPNLEPVRNNQIDLGIRFTSDKTYVSVNAYLSDLKNYISLVDLPDPDAAGALTPARSYANIDARIRGAEASIQSALAGDLYLTGTLTYTRGENRDLDEPLAEMPPLSGSVYLRYDVSTWFVEVGERFADRQDRTSASLNEQETAGWGVTDLKGGYNFAHWSVLGGVNNLFDTYYFTHLSYQRDPFRSGAMVPESGRTLYLTLNYRY